MPKYCEFVDNEECCKNIAKYEIPNKEAIFVKITIKTII